MLIDTCKLSSNKNNHESCFPCVISWKVHNIDVPLFILIAVSTMKNRRASDVTLESHFTHLWQLIYTNLSVSLIVMICWIVTHINTVLFILYIYILLFIIYTFKCEILNYNSVYLLRFTLRSLSQHLTIKISFMSLFQRACTVFNAILYLTWW